MSLNPENDGIDHINTYSRGATTLGRFLSNFWVDPAGSYIDTEDGPFKTIEGYWYWLGCRDERLRDTTGLASKKLGRELLVPDFPKLGIKEFQHKIAYAITVKIFSHPEFADQLRTSVLPLVHYYVYDKRVIEVRQVDWLMAYLDFLRQELNYVSDV